MARQEQSLSNMNTSLKELYYRLQTLTVFAPLKEDSVIDALRNFLMTVSSEAVSVSLDTYSRFVGAVYQSESGHLGKHIETICCDCENVYVKQLGAGKLPGIHIQKAVEYELDTLQILASLTKEDLCTAIQWDGYLPSFPSGEVDIQKSFRERT